MVQALPQVDRIWDLNGLLGRSPGDRDAIQRAFDVLSTVTFTALDKTVALTLLDEMFLSSVDKEFGVLQIPRWTADLIARLAARRNADRVLDIYGSVGNLSAALRLNGLDARYLEVFVATPQEAAWTFIQQLIVAPDATMPVLVAGNEPAELSPEPPVQFERVVVAPPFGRSKAARLGQYGGAKTLEESFLLRGLKRTARGGRLVALVPSRLLSDPSREKFRREIIERNQLIAVIDLGALLPVSSVAVSALVIEPGISSGAKTFFASAAGLQHEDSFDCRALPSVAEVLQEFLRWDSLRKLPAEYEPSASTRVVLEIAQGTQISPGTYLATNNERDLPISSYPLAALDTVSMIQRGKSIRRRDGDIPFISPSSIRTLSLELDSRDVTTSEEHEAFGGVRARAGDVVINGISTYLGAAALVESGEFAVNRHVFLVRPDHKRILPEYLAIALNSRLVRDALKQEASGSLISGLTTKALQALLIPLPSIAIQRRIVAHVDAVKHCHDEAKLALNARARELQLAVDLLGMEIDQ
jgi:hypothetical protein